MTENKLRLDVFLVKSNLVESRHKAQMLIEQGKVTVNGAIVKKTSTLCSQNDEISITEGLKYVSRGGLKLEAALEAFKIDVSGLKGIDIGSSTGGFTHCLLIAGATAVCAIDVGSNQLHPTLAEDSRVVVMEHTDIRNVEARMLPFAPDFFVCDLSFISITKVLSSIKDLLEKCTFGVFLIKPQFELGKVKLGKNGIVADKNKRESAVKSVIDAVKDFGFTVLDFIPSPVTGGDGNVEYLVHVSL